MSIQNIFPGSKGASDEGANPKRQNLGFEEQSKLYEELNRLPLEMMEITVHHLTDPEVLESVSKISVTAKSAVLNVINTRNEHLAVKELKVLGDWSLSQAKHQSSVVNFYKECLADLQAQVQNPLARVQIDDSKLKELKQILTAYTAGQVEQRSRKLKQACYVDILSGSASIEGIDDKYARLKREMVSEALEHIISSSDSPQEARGLVVYHAANAGQLEIVKVLLANGAIPQNDIDEAITGAAQNGHLEIVKVLLENGAQISEEDRGEAITDAAHAGQLEMVKFLLENGEISGLYIYKAVSSAARKGHLEIVKFLLANGKISEVYRGWAVKNAAQNGHLEVVQLLLENGAQISVEDRGWAVRNAACGGYLEMVKFLLENGEISVEARDLAIKLAAELRYLDVEQFLLSNGAQIPKQDRGEAPKNATDIDHYMIEPGLLELQLIKVISKLCRIF